MLNTTVPDQIYIPLTVALVVAFFEGVIVLFARPSMDVVEPKPGRLYTTVVSEFVLSSAALLYLFCQFNLAQVYYALVDMKTGNHLTALCSYLFWGSLAAHIALTVTMPIVGVKYWCARRRTKAVRQHSLKCQPHGA